MKGYVAFLDVLGFSALVTADPAGASQRKFVESLRAVTQRLDCKFVVASDSIILTADVATDTHNEEAFLNVLEDCSRIFADLLEEYIAIRGAISYGHYERERIGECDVIVGSAVIDAYRYEQRQDWVGIMIAPSAVDQLKDIGSNCYGTAGKWSAFLQLYDRIPFHPSPNGNNDYFGFAVVPATNGGATQICSTITRSIVLLKWMRAIAPSPDEQQKYLRAIDWLVPILSMWAGASKDEAAAFRIEMA